MNPLLCYSDLFVYKHVFNNIGILNYKIINDIDIIKKELTDNNIIVVTVNSMYYFTYLLNNEIRVIPYNTNLINSLDKKYILLIGNNNISKSINKPIYKYEDNNSLYKLISNSK